MPVGEPTVTTPSSVSTVSVIGGISFSISSAVFFCSDVNVLIIVLSPVAVFSCTRLPAWSIAKLTNTPGA